MTDHERALSRLRNRIDRMSDDDSAEAVDQIVRGHLEAIGDVSASFYRETPDGAQLLLVAPAKLIILQAASGGPGTAPTVALESRSLRDAVVAMKTTGIGMTGGAVSTEQTWTFKFPDGIEYDIEGQTSAGEPNDAERVARAALEQTGR